MSNPRDPLTLHVARTLRETRRDAHDWWEGPAESQHVLGFGGAMRPSRRRHRAARPGLLRRTWRALVAWLAQPSPWSHRP